MPESNHTYPFMEWRDAVWGATLEEKVLRGIEEFKSRYEGQMPDLILVPENDLSGETTIENITVRPDKHVLSGDIWLMIEDQEEALKQNGFL